MEDRIWSDKPYIKNASKYIKEIHVSFVDPGYEAYKRQVRSLLIEAKKKGIPTFVYTDKKAAANLDKRKAVKLSELDLKTEPKEPSRSFGRRDDMAPWLELYEKNDKAHLSTEPFGGAQRRLQGFRYSDGIKLFEAEVHYSKKGTPALHKIVQVLKTKKWDMKAFYKHLQTKWLELA